MPWLKNYFDRGIVGISVHGYDWTFLQLDITQSALIEHADTECVDWMAASLEVDEIKNTYGYLKTKLIQARYKFLLYYGVDPLSFTVPTDYYDELGYNAVHDAGFKVFSAHQNVDQHPSVEFPVNYFGVRDINGMYRISTASDVCSWVNCGWGNVFDISKVADITDYCKYHETWDETLYSESSQYDIAAELCTALDSRRVAAITIHSDCLRIKKVNQIFPGWRNWTK